VNRHHQRLLLFGEPHPQQPQERTGTELERLLDLHKLFFEPPKAEDMVAIEGPLADQVAADLAALGFTDLDDWVGVENYEMRVAGNRIDRAVLDVLRDQAARQRPTL